MGNGLCPMDAKPTEVDDLRVGESDGVVRPLEAAQLGTSSNSKPEPPCTWESADAQSCDAELLVIAAIQAFCPAALRRYLQRRSQVTGFRCFEYSPYEDGGFRINVPSHALTIDTAIDEKWKERLASEGDYPVGSMVVIKIIGLNALAKIEAGDGDKSKLRLVKVMEM